MAASQAKSVAAYLEELPAERRAVVSKLRALVKKNLPKGYVETMSFGYPAYVIPLARYPDTYNGQPLCYAAIAANKNYYSLYLMNAYGDPKEAKKLKDGFSKAGKKLDMGKSCLRFKSLDEIPLDVVGDVIASTPMDAYIEMYRRARAKTAKGK